MDVTIYEYRKTLFMKPNDSLTKPGKKRKKPLKGLAFLLPAFILVTVFFIYPAILSFRYSVTDWNGINTKYRYIGLDNFLSIIKLSEFRQVLFNSFYLIILYVPILNLLSLLMAVLIYDIGKLASFYKVIIYFPNILSMVVVGVIWRIIYNPAYGPLAFLLEKLGLNSLIIDWLGLRVTVLPSMSVAIIWYAVGFYLMIYLGGLSTIPVEIYESADIDGIKWHQKLLYITIPMIAQSITVNIVISTIAILSIFDLPYVLTRGGPGYGSTTMALMVYIYAYNNLQQGHAMAVAIMLTIVTLVVSLFQLGVLRRREVIL